MGVFQIHQSVGVSNFVNFWGQQTIEHDYQFET